MTSSPPPGSSFDHGYNDELAGYDDIGMDGRPQGQSSNSDLDAMTTAGLGSIGADGNYQADLLPVHAPKPTVAAVATPVAPDPSPENANMRIAAMKYVGDGEGIVEDKDYGQLRVPLPVGICIL